MSLLDTFTKKKKLTAAIEQTAKARSNEGKTADQLYKGAYHDYAEVLAGDSLRADALYNWGFALLHHAKSKTDEEAISLFEEAIAKFSFCLLLHPAYLGAAINGGVAFMDLARFKQVAYDDALYEKARTFFETANVIQAGSASYNLACIYGLRDEGDACLKALENAKSRGYLPESEEILNDPDMDKVKNQAWFEEFIAELVAEEVVTETTEANDNTIQTLMSSAVEESSTSAKVAEETASVEEDSTEHENNDTKQEITHAE